MSFFDEESDRHVIPDWRLSYRVASSPELQPLKPGKIAVSISRTNELAKEFSGSPTTGVALDLLNSARFDHGHEHDVDLGAAITQVLSERELPEPARRLAASLSDDPNSLAMTQNTPSVNSVRRRLRHYPDDPLGWVDLARHFASFGKKDKSLNAIAVALGLAPNHRWITRVAVRSFTHFGDPERAHDLLVRHPALRTDPWIMAAELAVAPLAHRGPKNWKAALSLLDGDFSPLYVSELASAIGTLEFSAGSVKRVKKYFKKSLLVPTGNSLAQAKWLERVSHITILNHQIDVSEDANEALFWQSYKDEDMAVAMQYAEGWLEDEPFSSRAAIMGGYVAALLDDYDKVKDFSSKGLNANPTDSVLKNNYIFSIIAQYGSLPFDQNDKILLKFLKELTKYRQDPDTAAQAFANIGLIYYRSGDFLAGRVAYEEAIKIFDTAKNISAGMARLNHCREAIFAKAEWTGDLARELKYWMSQASSVSPGFNFYLNRIKNIAKGAEEWISLPEKKTTNPLAEKPSTSDVLKFKVEDGQATIYLSSSRREKNKN